MNIASIVALSFHMLLFDVSAQNSVTEAEEFFLRFNNVSGGWCASDATISVLLPDGKTLWLFGDTFIGEKDGEYSIKPFKSKMINNSAIIDDGSNLAAIYNGTFENPSSLIPGIGQDIFWPEHGIVENDTVKIFAVRVSFEDNGIPGFNFRVGTSYLAYFKYPEMQHIKTSEIESVTDTLMRFGACLVRSEDYLYIFGVKDTTHGGYKYPLPYLARVESGLEESWQFYAGYNNWSFDCNDAVPVGDRPVSESFYVYEKNGKFYLIMHEIWLVGELFILESDNITGPWNRAVSGGNENRFAIIKPHDNNITYNLFAHPQFMKDDEILISFNVNTTDFSSIYKDTRNYRARFYWLSTDKAANTSIPDTIVLFNEPDWTGINGKETGNAMISYCRFSECIHLAGVISPSLLTIFGLDGRVYLNRQVPPGDSFISCSHLPGPIIISRLQGEWGVETRKVILR